MKIIGSQTSPFVRKVRIVMAEKKLDYRFELEDVWGSNAILKINPLGKVPCLVMDGGEVIYDSRVIVEYVDTLSPVARLIPERGRERVEVRVWEALADGLLDACVSLRNEQTWEPRGDHRSQAWMDRQTLKIQEALKAMARGLAEKPWCTGNHLSLADIAVGCGLGYLDFRFPAMDWRNPHPNLDRLYTKLSARQSFVDTVPA